MFLDFICNAIALVILKQTGTTWQKCQLRKQGWCVQTAHGSIMCPCLSGSFSLFVSSPLFPVLFKSLSVMWLTTAPAAIFQFIHFLRISFDGKTINHRCKVICATCACGIEAYWHLLAKRALTSDAANLTVLHCSLCSMWEQAFLH